MPTKIIDSFGSQTETYYIDAINDNFCKFRKK